MSAQAATTAATPTLNEIYVARIIEQAVRFVDIATPWQTYNVAASALKESDLTPAEYESAIARLAEALKI